MHHIDTFRYENPPEDAKWLRRDLFPIVYSQLENELLAIGAQYHALIHPDNKEHQFLEPFFAYLNSIKQDMRDTVCDPTPFLQLQRYIFLLFNIDLKDPILYKVWLALKAAYFRAAQRISQCLVIDGYKAWLRQDLAQHPHSLVSILGWCEASQFITRHHRQQDIKSISLETILEDFSKYLQEYIKREDHWYSRRPKEAILMARHLLSVILDASLNKNSWMIKTICESPVQYSLEIMPQAPGTNAVTEAVHPQPQIPKIPKDKLIYYYLLYQVVGLLGKPFSKKQDKDFNRYLYQFLYFFVKKLLSQNQDKDNKEYWLFLQKILHPERVCKFVENEITDKKLKVNKLIYKKLLPSVRILISLARISNAVTCKSKLTFALPYNQYQFEAFFDNLHFQQIKTFSHTSIDLFREKFQNPRKNPLQTYEPKIVHLFLAGHFLLALKELDDIDDKEIFWSIYTAHSENAALEIVANFVHGALPEVIGTFALYQYLIAYQAQIFDQYVAETTNGLAQAINLKDLSLAIFGRNPPSDNYAQLQEIHRKIMLYINHESEC